MEKEEGRRKEREEGRSKKKRESGREGKGTERKVRKGQAKGSEGEVLVEGDVLGWSLGKSWEIKEGIAVGEYTREHKRRTNSKLIGP